MAERGRGGRVLAAVAAIAALALPLSACVAEDEHVVVSDASIGVAVPSDVTSFNPATTSGATVANATLWYATHDTFAYEDDRSQIVFDEGFGRMEKVSDDPLTVRYTLAEGLLWSDGEPITADDLLLGWAAESGYFDDVAYDPATGEAVSGTRYFDVAGSTAGIRDTALPETSGDGRTLTLRYDAPFADWDRVWLLGQPAHVVAEHAGVTEDELVAAIRSTPRGDPAHPAPSPDAVLRAAADFWNTGFDATALPGDPSLFVSNGPFVVTAWTPGESMTLEPNPDYRGDRAPAFTTLVLRFLGDAQAQVDALRAGDVDVVSPPATADVVAQLRAVPGAQVLTGGLASYDHVDLSFRGDLADPAVRRAFLEVVPRQRILDEVVTPIAPDAGVLDSWVYPSQAPEYERAVAENGSDAYADVDVEGATALLAGRTPTVRVLYDPEDPARVAAFQAIQETAAQAGFQVVDAGSPDWRSLLGGDGYDVAVFAWDGLGDVELPEVFGSTGWSNFTGVNVPEIDALVDAIPGATDPGAVEDARIGLDRLLFDNAYGLPLFQDPGVQAASARLSGVTFMPGAIGPVWDFWRWTVADPSATPAAE